MAILIGYVHSCNYIMHMYIPAGKFMQFCFQKLEILSTFFKHNNIHYYTELSKIIQL